MEENKKTEVNTCLLYTSGQLEHVFKVGKAAHTGRGVEVAHSGGHSSHPHAGLGALDGAGVVAAGDILLGLPGDVVILGQAPQIFKEPAVVDLSLIHI